jgi:hypothetical protein
MDEQQPTCEHCKYPLIPLEIESQKFDRDRRGRLWVWIMYYCGVCHGHTLIVRKVVPADLRN